MGKLKRSDLLKLVGPPLDDSILLEIEKLSRVMIEKGIDKVEIKTVLGPITVVDTFQRAIVGAVDGHVLKMTAEFLQGITIVSYIVDRDHALVMWPMGAFQAMSS